ncbi:glycosyltransferase family 4 protein [Micromonospora schwarzwaldensis]|uniref:glycosyltransferase family 4 protein n=1 Tax=Micromonospora sp. DSM 45708 TaxID=3111767 RepID=UPI0031E08779
MRILMLSWEYPPLLVGGLGRHVHALSVALAEAGHEVTVLTRGDGATRTEERHEKVRIVRSGPDPALPALDKENLVPWVLGLNHALTRSGLGLTGPFDVVHAHDWLVAHAAASLTRHTRAPLVVTLHATEAGRHHGLLANDLNRTIHRIESWTLGMAHRVIVCSAHMRGEAGHLFDVPRSNVEVVPNGVDRESWRPDATAVETARRRYGRGGPLLTYAGRLAREKGVPDLLLATAELRHRHPGLRLVVAGDGARRAELADEAARLGLGDTVEFAGFLPHPELAALMGAATALVVPSIYEPFGMVALEAAAAGVPRVVAATGGLLEYVTDGKTALTYPPSDVRALTDAIDRLLARPALARRLSEAASATLGSDFSWLAVARRTAEVYQRVVRDVSAG